MMTSDLLFQIETAIVSPLPYLQRLNIVDVFLVAGLSVYIEVHFFFVSLSILIWQHYSI